MSDAMDAVQVNQGEAGLSQVQRLVDAFVAPSKTFTDIKRSQSWWLPFLLAAIVSYGFMFAVDKQVGFNKVVENQMKQTPAGEEQLAKMTPAQENLSVAITKGVFYAFPVLSLLIGVISAAVLLASLNFGLGGQAKFGEMLAVWFYATVPGLIKALLMIVTLFAGVGADEFNVNNPVGTNVAYYLSPDAPKWLSTLLTSVDIFTIWTAILLVIGCSIVAKVKRGSAAVVVCGWWLIIVLFGVVMAAIRG